MSYTIIIPKNLLCELHYIREKTGKSIRLQVLEAVRSRIRSFRELEEHAVHDFTGANILLNGGEKHGTT